MDNKLIGNERDIIFYTDEEGNTNIEVILQNEDIWLNAQAIAELFEITDKVVYKHIKNIYAQDELEEDSTVAKIATMGKNGQTYQVKYYNLDMIISVGYRVNSKKAVKFRQWASKIIKEYIIKGFVLDDERFLKGGKVNKQYFDELLERIKVIRTSERMAYQKITDIFIATSINYDKKSEEASTFFKTVQNKLHYAITSHTAAELIYERANAEKENMGLTTWKEAPNGMIYKYDVGIAKNYLEEAEMKKLNNLTNLFLDYAEAMAEDNQVMTMKDWINETDSLLKFRKKEILQDSGKISHKQAIEKAENEYEKYKIIQDKKFVSDFDMLLLEAENFNKTNQDK